MLDQKFALKITVMKIDQYVQKLSAYNQLEIVRFQFVSSTLM